MAYLKLEKDEISIIATSAKSPMKRGEFKISQLNPLSDNFDNKGS